MKWRYYFKYRQLAMAIALIALMIIIFLVDESDRSFWRGAAFAIAICLLGDSIMEVNKKEKEDL